MNRRILIVEKLKKNREMLHELLDADYNVMETIGSKGAIETLSQDAATISVILLDLTMPRQEGYEVLDYMQQTPELTLIPVIAVLSKETDEAAENALKHGATDYVTKPYKPLVLKNRLLNASDKRVSQQQSKAVSAQLELIMQCMSSGLSICYCHEDGTTEMLYANEHFYEQRGYTKKQYEKEISHVTDLVYIEDVIRIDEEGLRGDKSHAPLESCYRIVKRDGTIAWVKSRVSISRMEGCSYPVRIAITEDITNEQTALDQVKEKDAFLQMILDNIGSGITASFLNQKRTDYLFANEQFYMLQGYTKQQYQAEIRTPFQRICPADLDRVLRAFQSIRLLDKPVTLEYSITCRDNTIKKVRMLSVNRRLDFSEQDIQLSVYTDITEESREEERSKELIENMPCGAGIFDISGGMISGIYLNRKYWELVGREPMLEGEFPMMDSIQLNDRSLLPMLIQKIILTKKEQECEIHVLHGDGRYIPILVRGIIMHQKPGKSRLYATCTSIEENILTFRRMLPVALETMMAASHDIFFVKDRAFRYVCASRSFAQLAGIPDEKDMIGKTDYDLFESEIADRFHVEDEQMMNDGRSMIDQREELPSNDGYIKQMRTSKYLLHDAYRNVIGIYGISREVTVN